MVASAEFVVFSQPRRSIRMKAKALVFIALLFAVSPGFAFAKDKIEHYVFQNAVTVATESGKLEGTVKFYLAGNTPNGQITIVNDDIEVNRKTNAFGKRDEPTCNWALQ